ncbi:MAG: DUF4982 domain-containing protein [Bacteroidales bacterium]|nr:DUF4982 domain-containing protein [Bacteroidales bacterium]
MRYSWVAVIMLLILYSLSGCSTQDTSGGRKIFSFNRDWYFAKDLPGDNYAELNQDTSAFKEVILPHTPKIEPLVVNNQWMGTSWYRKTFIISSSQKNKEHYLYFEGAMQNADVYLNGKHIFSHTGGYLPFVVSLDKYLVFGKPNLVAVKLVNTDDTLVPPGKPLKDLDFCRYGGIYRDVKFITTSKLHITFAIASKTPGGGGVFVNQDTISSEVSKISIKTEIVNQNESQKTFSIQQVLKDDSGKIVAEVNSAQVRIRAGETLSLTQNMTINHPGLWSPQHPYLYRMETKVIEKNREVDNLTTKIGLRRLKLTPEGLYINGKKEFLSGTNRHQEYPYVGYALSDEAQWRDAVKIKDAGFNVVRLSHYPQSPVFMDACDSLGIVVMDAIPGWQFLGGKAFRKHVLTDERELIRRDRNRACVFFWELSLNETWMPPSLMDSILVVKNQEFPEKKPITCAWIDHPGFDLFIPARQHGHPPDYWYNYKDGKRPIFIAEYGDWEYYAQNAGFNQTQFKGLKPEDRSSRQPRDAGEIRLLQQALNFQEAANSDERGRGKGIIGQANWLMFDYNRGYTNDIETSGIADIFRIPKFSYYFYRSQRDPNESVTPPATGGPMVYIASYWQKNSTPIVRVFSNCQQVELFVNGHSVGKQNPDHDRVSTYLPHPPFTFKLRSVAPGTLKAVGYIDNKPVAEETISTPDKPNSLVLQVDTSGIPISNKHKDVLIVHASIVDKKGTVCHNSSLKVNFEVHNAKLVGENPFPAQAGIASVVMLTEPVEKPITISAEVPGMKKVTIQIKEGK